MNEMRNFTNTILGTLLLIITTANFSTAQTIVRGVVRDAVSKEPLQSVSVYVQDGKGVTTKEDGTYSYTTYRSGLKKIQFSYVGYKPMSKAITANQEQTIDVELVLADATGNVTVKSKRGKYSNKNNPAVDL